MVEAKDDASEEAHACVSSAVAFATPREEARTDERDERDHLDDVGVVPVADKVEERVGLRGSARACE